MSKIKATYLPWLAILIRPVAVLAECNRFAFLLDSDLSVCYAWGLQWALDKLVDDSSKWGVFGIRYRTIDCNTPIADPAPAIPLVADPHAGNKPANLNCASQGAAASTQSLSTESSSATRAVVPKSPTKASSIVPNKGNGHSAKFWNRRKVMRSTSTVRGCSCANSNKCVMDFNAVLPLWSGRHIIYHIMC